MDFVGRFDLGLSKELQGSLAGFPRSHIRISAGNGKNARIIVNENLLLRYLAREDAGPGVRSGAQCRPTRSTTDIQS
jgi:hypothetical protein